MLPQQAGLTLVYWIQPRRGGWLALHNRPCQMVPRMWQREAHDRNTPAWGSRRLQFLHPCRAERLQTTTAQMAPCMPITVAQAHSFKMHVLNEQTPNSLHIYAPCIVGTSARPLLLRAEYECDAEWINQDIFHWEASSTVVSSQISQAMLYNRQVLLGNLQI